MPSRLYSKVSQLVRDTETRPLIFAFVRSIAACWGLFVLALVTRYFFDRPSPVHLFAFAVIGIAGTGYFTHIFIKCLPIAGAELNRKRKVSEAIEIEIQERIAAKKGKE